MVALENKNIKDTSLDNSKRHFILVLKTSLMHYKKIYQFLTEFPIFGSVENIFD